MLQLLTDDGNWTGKRQTVGCDWRWGLVLTCIHK